MSIICDTQIAWPFQTAQTHGKAVAYNRLEDVRQSSLRAPHAGERRVNDHGLADEVLTRLLHGQAAGDVGVKEAVDENRVQGPDKPCKTLNPQYGCGRWPAHHTQASGASTTRGSRMRYSRGCCAARLHGM